MERLLVAGTASRGDRGIPDWQQAWVCFPKGRAEPVSLGMPINTGQHKHEQTAKDNEMLLKNQYHLKRKAKLNKENTLGDTCKRGNKSLH